jgi:GTP-binding protein
MPGDGVAARSVEELEEWNKMSETYLSTREQLKGLILVMDIRREWSEDEELLRRFSETKGFPLVVVLTKADKMSRSQMLQAVQKMKKATGLNAVFASSALKKTGQEEIEDYIYHNLVKS